MDSKLDQEGIVRSTVEENVTEPVSYATDIIKEEYVQKIRNFIDDQYYEAIIKTYAEKLQKILPSTVQNIPSDEKDTRTVAEECVRNGTRPFIGSDVGYASESDIYVDLRQSNKVEVINEELEKIFKDLEQAKKLKTDPKVLFLAAPKPSKQHGHRIPPEAFKQECDTLSKMWPFIGEQRNNATHVVEIRSNEQMKTETKQFLTSVEKDKIGRAVIIFNGHGSCETNSKQFGGLCDLAEGKGMAAEIFLKYVASNIPKDAHVQLIFASCCVHLIDSAILDEYPMLTVTWFTRTDGSSSSYVIHFQVGDMETGNLRWCNLELESYMKGYQKQMIAHINMTSTLSSAKYVEKEQPDSAMETDEAAESKNRSLPKYEEIIEDDGSL